MGQTFFEAGRAGEPGKNKGNLNTGCQREKVRKTGGTDILGELVSLGKEYEELKYRVSIERKEGIYGVSIE